MVIQTFLEVLRPFSFKNVILKMKTLPKCFLEHVTNVKHAIGNQSILNFIRCLPVTLMCVKLLLLIRWSQYWDVTLVCVLKNERKYKSKT